MFRQATLARSTLSDGSSHGNGLFMAAAALRGAIMNGFPAWTEYRSSEIEHRGLDPLGLTGVGSNIVQKRLLPGITNATRHVRYYSFFCWVFWSFWQQNKGKTKPSEQWKWLVRLEHVWRAATLLQFPSVTGLIGVTKALRVEKLKQQMEIRLDKDTAPTAFTPANYSASFGALGCGRWSPEKGAHLTPFAEKVALAFDSEVHNAVGKGQALKSILSNQKSITVKDIHAVATSVCMRPVTKDQPEQRLLIELLLRMDPFKKDTEATDQHRARSRSLALLMEVAEQSEGKLSTGWDLHRVFATEILPNQHRFLPSPQFQNDFELWKRYQERQYVKIAVYSLWHETVLLLGYRATKCATAQEILGHLLISASESTFLKEQIGTGGLQKDVRSVLEKVRESLRHRPRDFGKTAIRSTETLLDQSTPTAVRVGTALHLLFLCSSFWLENKGQLSHAELHRDGGRRALSLAIVCSDLQQFCSSPTVDYVSWIIENYVLKQAIRVAIDKLPNYRFFVLRDEEGYRLVKAQDPNSYLAYDISRIDSAYRLMEDLRLIDISGGLRLTSLGRKTLERLRNTHNASL